MSHSTISLGLGLGGGKAATSSGAQGGGGTPFANTKSVTFDGVGDYATVSPGWIASDADYTLSMWLNVDTFPAPPLSFALCTTLASSLSLFPAGKAQFETRTGSNWAFGVKEVLSGAAEDTWFHLAMVKQANVPSGSSTFTYYVNGSSVGTFVKSPVAATYAFGSSAGAAQVVFVARYTSAGYYGNILLDEMAIFTSIPSGRGGALDATAISGIWGGGTPSSLSSLAPRNWYRMGDGTEAGSGTTVYDMGASAGTTTDMTLVTAAYSTDVP